ncbi:MAG: hypothetical protein ACKVIH_01585 [Burkholderiales bacterium]
MFGLFKRKTYPTMTPQIIQPPGLTPSAAEAKSLYCDYMIAIGFYRKDRVESMAGHFARHMREHETALREAISDYKPDVKQAKSELKECQAELKAAATPKEKTWAEQAVHRAEAALAQAEAELEKAAEALEAFKQDKRPFLIGYVNKEVHGDDAEGGRGGN